MPPAAVARAAVRAVNYHQSRAMESAPEPRRLAADDSYPLRTTWVRAVGGRCGWRAPGIRAERLARVAHIPGATEIAADASVLAERIAAGRFYVACVGQFKRGKSTLINALVGLDVHPTGVLPVTTVVTVLREGPRLPARVRFTDGRVEEIDPEALARYVTEDENPDNAKQVAVVEIALPSPLLHSGMCLVYTPGLGSVFEANTAVTEGFVPRFRPEPRPVFTRRLSAATTTSAGSVERE